MPKIATADRVGRDQLLDFVRPRHRVSLMTTRRDGRPQISPVTAGVDDLGRIVISTYPDRAKAINARRDPAVTALVHSDEWDGPFVQVDGTAEVLDMPAAEAEDALVDYFRCIAGEHPDWDEYRQAMRRQGKSLIRITIDRWGPIATGGFPPDRARECHVNGAQAVVRTLVGSGVTTCFANPGTSEMHFVAALDAVPEMRGVLCLFEGVATGAADGYGRMTGKPAAALLHLGPGLANGLANLHNARRAHTPLLAIVGDHATYHKRFDAPLESDIDALAGSVSGWVRRSRARRGAPADAVEAVAAALRPPGQVATLILPADVTWTDGAEPVCWRRSRCGSPRRCRRGRSLAPRCAARLRQQRGAVHDPARRHRAAPPRARGRQPDRGSDRRAGARRDVPGAARARCWHPERRPPGVPGRVRRQPARRYHAT